MCLLSSSTERSKNKAECLWLRSWRRATNARCTGNPEAMTQLKSILTSREAIYDRALARLDTTGKPAKQSLDDLLEFIEAHQSN